MVDLNPLYSIWFIDVYLFWLLQRLSLLSTQSTEQVGCDKLGHTQVNIQCFLKLVAAGNAAVYSRAGSGSGSVVVFNYFTARHLDLASDNRITQNKNVALSTEGH